MSHDQYVNPLVNRYASEEMGRIFSPFHKYHVWHQLWIALAESEKELGLDISDAQINEMRSNLGKIDFDKVSLYEKKSRHEVIAHIEAWGEICPLARPIIHLGATSAFVMDNGDMIQIKEGLELLKKRLVNLIKVMADFAKEYKSLPVLGYTHFQPAQLTTLGKRVVLWLYDFILDYEDLEYRLEKIQLRGVKGTVGTQDSFMNLFNKDEGKIKRLEKLFDEKMGFKRGSVPVCGQTYTRKWDYLNLTALSNLAQSAHKIATDIRLLQGLQELEEPFGEKQVGSSAMPYKRNPMRSERVCSLSRFVMQMTDLGGQNHAAQWLERTLDDSANRRMMIPESFLAMDAILLIMTNIFQGMKVYPKLIERRIKENLPFLTAEHVIMESVKKGGDRQEAHARFRDLAMEAVYEMKELGIENDLIKKLGESPDIDLSLEELQEVLKPENMTGRAESQVKDFIDEVVNPIISKNSSLLDENNIDLKV